MKPIGFKLNKFEKEVVVQHKNMQLNGILAVPENSRGLIIFAHGSGSSRWSSRNNFVARELQKKGLATLLMDLLTPQEETNRENVFDIQTLAQRLIFAKDWCRSQIATENLSIGYFGASTGAGAALVAAAKDPVNIFAIVSRGGRPDLAGTYLKDVNAPTLLIVGGEDGIVIDMNREAYRELHSIKEIEIIPGATHLFEEPGTLEQVAQLACDWFTEHLHESFSVQKRHPPKDSTISF